MQIRPSNVLLFADDLAILFLLKDEFQEQLKLLEKYCLDWVLEINTEKAKVITLMNSKSLNVTTATFFIQYTFIPFEKNLESIDNLINKER